MSLLLIVLCIFSSKFCRAILFEPEREDDRCEAIIKGILLENRDTAVDETPYRLHSTWLSQECEVRTGPEYLIRKYTFFENGTFLLLRHHYAEESCSIATHTVVARGSIKISSPSVLILGATETKVQLDTVHLIPLNRQVAHKFERKLNVSCGGVESKWRPYTDQLVYERSSSLSGGFALSRHGPSYNSLYSNSSHRKARGLHCLESLGIEFSELRLLRVERKRHESESRVELLLGGIPRNARSRGTLRPTWLQPTALLRVDTTSGCPICGSVSRGTEYSPPLLHEVPPLPAMIGGLWLSTRCESVEGGFWSRRIFRVYSADRRWAARWDYYADSNCSIFLYAATASGSYVQRPARRKRNERSLESNNYRHILRDTEASMARSFVAILRGNRKEEIESDKTTEEKTFGRTTFTSTQSLPSGTTELELRVVESLLIPIDGMVSVRCTRGAGGKEMSGIPLTFWPRNCVPRAVEAPSILSLRARLGLDWNGRYTLLLGSQDDDLWEAPLRRCSEIPTQSYIYHPKSDLAYGSLRQSHHAPRYGIFASGGSIPNPAIFMLPFFSTLYILTLL